MKIAVEGCCHGELDKIYETVTQLEAQNGFKIDVLIICGDFQSVRNMDDLQAMAVPPKYQKLNTFYKYYSGEKVAPVLTVFVGGNHEASNYLQELPYGGWVARNIYYLGYAGIIQIGGVRIGGISGIYKGNDYNKGHYEHPPYDEGSKRSVYHVRNLEVFRLKQVTQSLDIFVSHDWPTGIYNYGNAATLIRNKPFFKKEVEEGTLGSKPCADLLKHLQPSYWFAAHLHVKFAAYVQHTSAGDVEKATKFLALDKCLPRRKFLQVLDVPHKEAEGLKIKLDPEWLHILQSTNHLLNTTSMNRFMPGPGGNVRCDFAVSDSDMDAIRELFGGDMTLPENFLETAPAFSGNPNMRHRPSPLCVCVNPQTTLICTMLDITDPNAKLLGKTSEQLLQESNIGLVSSERGDDDDNDDKDDEPEDAVDIDSDMNESSANNATFNPSFIDSSLDLSQSSSASFSSNISGSWDHLRGAGDNSVIKSPSAASGKNVKEVSDDDDELQSILLAQKSKSLPPTPQPAPCKSSDNVIDDSPASAESISSSSVLSSTPLHRSATAPARSSSSSPLSSSVIKNDSACPSSSSSSHSEVTNPRKLSVADRLKALNAKERQLKASSETSGNKRGGEADSTSSSSATTSMAPLSRLGSASDSSQTTPDTESLHPNLLKSDTLDCRGAQTRVELEALCVGAVDESVSVSSSTVSSSSTASAISERLSPGVKRASSELDANPADRSQGDEGSQTSASPSSSSSTGAGASGSAKKLKRRNVSMYQEESQD